MCELISWIEKDDKNFFVTGKDLRDSYIKKLMDGTKDVLGHGFCRKVYGVEGGKDVENRDFWDGNLPEEIKQAWNEGEYDSILKYLDSDSQAAKDLIAKAKEAISAAASAAAETAKSKLGSFGR